MLKNIIFDFGDIFINLDKQGTYNAMAALGVTNISEEMMHVYYQYEKGFMTTEAFINFYLQKFPFLTKEALVTAWNAILLDFPKHRLSFLKALATSKKYRLFLLSNTNELHISWIQNSLGMEFYNEFKNCFEQFYLSHEINLRKPDSEIYTYVLEENNLLPNETLFVDDLLENTVAAKELGISVWNLIPEREEVTDLFSKKEFQF